MIIEAPATHYKKVCLVGGFAVGKTSLVTRIVKNTFREKYLTTVGVRIEQYPINSKEKSLTLVLWDLAGEDELIALRESYLRGSSGCIVVADGTRPATIEQASDLIVRIRQYLGDVPIVVALNKNDLVERWVASDELINAVIGAVPVVVTSAKTGKGVESLFSVLAGRMLP